MSRLAKFNNSSLIAYSDGWQIWMTSYWILVIFLMHKKSLLQRPCQNNVPSDGISASVDTSAVTGLLLLLPPVPSYPPPPTDECATASLDAGKTLARKSITHLWYFAHEMWTHHNSTLHNSALPDCPQMKGADVDANITTLYNKVDSYAAENRWCFDLHLALRLHTPLRSCRQWLTLTRVLIDKSTNYNSRGQTKLTTFFQVLSPWRSHLTHQPSSPLPPGTSEAVKTKFGSK
jgi:hypothetical protein